MTKKIYVFLIAFLAIGIVKAQVTPADSLAGTYIGQSWYKSGSTGSWSITVDTTYVTFIDSVNCTLSMHNHFGLWYSSRRLYTSYYYCDTVIPPDYASPPDIYWYTLFHGGDSLTDCEYSIPQPMPNPHYYYYFYGVRVSNKITGIKELTDNNQVNIYPNPTTKDLTIEIPQKAIIEILNIDGQVIMTTAIIDRKAIIDLEGLSSGVYIIKATTDKGVVIKKFIKE